MKKFILPLGLILLTGLFASTALAGPHGRYYDGYRGDGGCQAYYQSIPPEKREAFNKITQEYTDKSAPILHNLWAERQELDALSRNPSTKPEQLSKITSDMRAQRSQLFDLHKEMRARVEKELGITMPAHTGGWHNGGGRGGYGHGGYGHRGYGNGGCDGYGFANNY